MQQLKGAQSKGTTTNHNFNRYTTSEIQKWWETVKEKQGLHFFSDKSSWQHQLDIKQVHMLKNIQIILDLSFWCEYSPTKTDAMNVLSSPVTNNHLIPSLWWHYTNLNLRTEPRKKGNIFAHKDGRDFYKNSNRYIMISSSTVEILKIKQRFYDQYFS